MEKENSIDVTVALPTWENKNIIWLQLESLCRQETKYKWELVVCEEQSENMAGEDMILSYGERLKNAGCQQITYIPLKDHVPLSKKWWIIAQHSKGSTFLLCASDNYSPKNRIEFTHNKIKEGYNWVDVGIGLFLHLHTFNTATFKNELFETGLFMGTKTSYIKKLVGPWPKKGIDGWIRSQMEIKPRYRHNKPLLGLHTDGANKISIGRKNHYIPKNSVSKYFNSPLQKIENIIDDENLINRLKSDFYDENFEFPIAKKLLEKEENRLKRYGKIV